MLRKLLCGFAVAVAAVALGGGAQASVVSNDNPYRSFNSGVNYGAQRWEQAHGRHHCHVVRSRR